MAANISPLAMFFGVNIAIAVAIALLVILVQKNTKKCTVKGIIVNKKCIHRMIYTGKTYIPQTYYQLTLEMENHTIKNFTTRLDIYNAVLEKDQVSITYKTILNQGNTITTLVREQ